MMTQRRAFVAVVVSVALISLTHFVTPSGPHAFHWVHILAQRLYFIPVLVAAAWLGLRATLVTTSLVTPIMFVHIMRDWRGFQMVQAEQMAEIASLWIAAAISGVLFRRLRGALLEIHDAHEETLSALAASLDLREHGTARHSHRVRDYSLVLADRLGMTGERERRDLALGALLHDIGKIGVPDRILLKESALSEEELIVIRKHPDLGASLIGGIESLAEACELVRSHHEKFDGTGYPRGLAGDAIPLGARIFAVADAFDAMTTDRPYRRAMSLTEAARRITEARSTHFDPSVVDAFLNVPFTEWTHLAERAERTG